MNKVIVNFQAKLSDVYDNSWCPDPSLERAENTLVWALKRCLSDKGIVNISDIKISYEVLNNADD